MKRSLLVRLRSNGAFYLVGALLLLLGVPLYQTLILGPTNFSAALDASGTGQFATYLNWLHHNIAQFIGYRILLFLAFALLLSLPFSLYRIIVAQEIVAQQEREAEELANPPDTSTDPSTEDDSDNSDSSDSSDPSDDLDDDESDDDSDYDDSDLSDSSTNTDDDDADRADGMPAHAWRGRGFAVIAMWAGLLGLIIYLLGILISTFYFATNGNNFSAGVAVPANIATLAALFALITNTVGIGLIALATLFFGAMIIRARLIWPGIWSAFAYAALAVTLLLSASAVATATAPTTGQSPLTTPATLLFALWVLWFGIMLIQLKAEA